MDTIGFGSGSAGPLEMHQLRVLVDAAQEHGNSTGDERAAVGDF